MNLQGILLTSCVVGLSLAVDGQNIFYPLIGTSIFSLILFVSLSLHKRNVEFFENSSLVLISFIFFIYISISSLVTYSLNRDLVAIVSTAPFLLFPLTVVIFSALRISDQDWDSIDPEKVCIYSAITFCALLIALHPQDFFSALTGRARFTWTEFRAVNPLPVLAASLFIWRFGLKSLFKIQFVFLILYIYATKYVNWMALILMAFVLRSIVLRYPRVRFSLILLSSIIIINTVIAVYWRDAVAIVPSEFERIFEIRIAYDHLIGNPLFGVGFGSAFANAHYVDKYSMHNLVAYILAFGGITALGLLFAMTAIYSKIERPRSEYIMIIYLILTATAASFKLPAIQFFMGLLFAAMAGKFAGSGARDVARVRHTRGVH